MFAEDGTLTMCLSSWYEVVFSSQWYPISRLVDVPMTTFELNDPNLEKLPSHRIVYVSATVTREQKGAMVVKDFIASAYTTMFAVQFNWPWFIGLHWFESPFRRTHLALHFWTKSFILCYIPLASSSWYAQNGWSCTTDFVGPLSCYTWKISWDFIY